MRRNYLSPNLNGNPPYPPPHPSSSAYTNLMEDDEENDNATSQKTSRSGTEEWVFYDPPEMSMGGGSFGNRQHRYGEEDDIAGVAAQQQQQRQQQQQQRSLADAYRHQPSASSAVSNTIGDGNPYRNLQRTAPHLPSSASAASSSAAVATPSAAVQPPARERNIHANTPCEDLLQGHDCRQEPCPFNHDVDTLRNIFPDAPLFRSAAANNNSQRIGGRTSQQQQQQQKKQHSTAAAHRDPYGLYGGGDDGNGEADDSGRNGNGNSYPAFQAPSSLTTTGRTNRMNTNTTTTNAAAAAAPPPSASAAAAAAATPFSVHTQQTPCEDFLHRLGGCPNGTRCAFNHNMDVLREVYPDALVFQKEREALARQNNNNNSHFFGRPMGLVGANPSPISVHSSTSVGSSRGRDRGDGSAATPPQSPFSPAHATYNLRSGHSAMVQRNGNGGSGAFVNAARPTTAAGGSGEPARRMGEATRQLWGSAFPQLLDPSAASSASSSLSNRGNPFAANGGRVSNNSVHARAQAISAAMGQPFGGSRNGRSGNNNHHQRRNYATAVGGRSYNFQTHQYDNSSSNGAFGGDGDGWEQYYPDDLGGEDDYGDDDDFDPENAIPSALLQAFSGRAVGAFGGGNGQFFSRGGRGSGSSSTRRNNQHNSSNSNATFGHLQPAGANIDVDAMSYEELQALGDRIGVVSKGLGQAAFDRLPTYTFKKRANPPPPQEGAAKSAPIALDDETDESARNRNNSQSAIANDVQAKLRAKFLKSKAGSADNSSSSQPTSGGQPDDKQNEECVICRDGFEDGDCVLALPLCGHTFHKDCLAGWTKDNRTCPICRMDI